MRKVIRAFALVIALAIPAFAGDIPYGVASTPPPANTTQQAGDIPYNVTGEIPYGITSLSQPTIANVLIDLIAQLIA